MSVTESPVSVRRILRAIALILLGLCAAIVLLWILPEGMHWREHRDIRLFAAVTRASYALQKLRDTHGKYPDSLSEAPVLSQAVADVRQECHALGHRVEDVQFVADVQRASTTTSRSCHERAWPQLGRFIQQDPIGDDINWYVYAANNPVLYIDPEGLLCWGDLRDWYMGGMGGASDWVDRNLLLGQTARYGHTAGLYDAGQASGWDVAREGAKWGGLVGAEAVLAVKLAPTSVTRLRNVGGASLAWGKNVRAEWHRFVPRRGPFRGLRLNLPHWHSRPPGKLGFHRPWEAWYADPVIPAPVVPRLYPPRSGRGGIGPGASDEGDC